MDGPHDSELFIYSMILCECHILHWPCDACDKPLPPRSADIESFHISMSFCHWEQNASVATETLVLLKSLVEMLSSFLVVNAMKGCVMLS